MSSDTITLDGKTEITNELNIGSDTTVTGNLHVEGQFFIGNTELSQDANGNWVMPTQEFETALDGISGEYFQADWLENDDDSRHYIKNKPIIPSPTTVSAEFGSGIHIATINGTNLYIPEQQGIDLSEYYSKEQVNQKFTRLVNKLEAALREALDDDSFNLNNWDTSQWDD